MLYTRNKQSAVNALVLLVVALVLTIPVAAHNLADPNFWFDESGQFWMAKGLNHFSAPLARDGSLYQVMLNNRQYNLDPGGFTLLLHYWLQGGSDPFWLRILPYIFLVLTLYFLMLTAVELGATPLWATGLAAIALAPFDMVLSYGFELRPYSMEVAGVVAAFYFLIRTVSRPTRANLLWLGLVCSFFLTSRYSFIIAVTAVGVTLLFFVFQRSVRSFFTTGYGFYVPVACTAVAIWLFSLSHQDPGGSTPFYVRGFVLQGKTWPQILELIKANFFTVRDLPYLLFIAVIPYLKFSRLTLAVRSRKACFRAAWLFLICFQAVSIVLSIFGKYPWHINTRWNLNLQALVMIAAVMLLVLAVDYLRLKPWTGLNSRWGKLAAVSCLLVLAIVATNKKVHYSNDALYPYLLSLGEPQLTNSRYFVGYFASPSVRYLFEYGPLKHRRDIYPQHFYFECRQEFHEQDRINTDQFDAALIALVDEATLKKYMERLDNRFVLVQGQPSSYLLIKSQ